jgi:tRNA(Ile)-lysidine synthase
LTGLLQQVRRTIRRHDLCPQGTRVLVALSGGSDSVALTLILRELAAHGGFTLVSVAHFNHGLRPTAARDEEFCREFAATLGLPLVVDSADVQGYAAAQRLSVEEAARRARYAFLHRAAADAGAERIAVGHTRDDQAETVLLKLIRGAGLTGLAGIYPRNGALIRPLIDVSRGDLRAYLATLRAGWVDDESNEDLDNPRNRIRHRVLPELDRAYGGATAGAIARAASLAREDGQWLDEVAARRYEEIAVRRPEGIEIESSALSREPLPLRRRLVLQGLRTIARGREVGVDHVDAALGVLAGDCPGVDLPGTRVELRRGKLVLIEQAPPPK